MFDWDKDGLKTQPAPITNGITTQPKTFIANI
jgi:hypothetical protein